MSPSRRSVLFQLSNEDYKLKPVVNAFQPRGEGGTPYDGLYGEPPPERGTFFRMEVCERVGISRVQVWERVGKTAI